MSPTDRRADATPVLDRIDQAPPELPTPITANEVDVPPPDRTPHPKDESTEVALTFERG